MGKRKNFKPEEIIAKLREAEILLAQGNSTSQVCRQISVSAHTSTNNKFQLLKPLTNGLGGWTKPPI